MQVYIKKIFGIQLGVMNQYSPKPVTPSFLAPHKKKETLLPRVSVITPSFNQGEFIGRTVDSVLGQSYPNLEYIIQDNCSSDNTSKCLQDYKNDQLSIFVEIDDGQADAINRGFEKSSGEIMCWLNSDDLFAPNILFLIADFFVQNPDVDVIYGNRIIINEHDQEIGRWLLPCHDSDVLRTIDYIPQETLFWRRCIWNKVGGGLNKDLKFAMDWDLLLRFQKAGAKFAHLENLYGYFRAHSKQKTSMMISSVGKQEMKRLRRQYNSSLKLQTITFLSHVKFLMKHIKLAYIANKA